MKSASEIPCKQPRNCLVISQKLIQRHALRRPTYNLSVTQRCFFLTVLIHHLPVLPSILTNKKAPQPTLYMYLQYAKLFVHRSHRYSQDSFNSSMASNSMASSKPFKWFASKNKSSTRRSLSLPLFRRSTSLKSPQTLFPNKSWPRSRSSSSKEAGLQQVFSFFDENKDGKVSVEELRAYFASVGDSMSREEAERVINEFDKDGDNSLEFGEFVELIQRDDGNEDSIDHVKKAFEMFEDETGSGCITPRGLQQVLKRLGNAKSFEECKAMIGVYDLDGNGVLDLNEFQMMMA